MKLVTNEEKYLKLVMKPKFKFDRKFSEILIRVDISQTNIKMVRPVYLD